ncbi:MULTISPECIES: DUF4097 family beta strand repeat-containing protein [unclassified Exiguobacterium]|uniref:DUF4097 family beta strand repeat-containing protein n=1 Tax=unclassified Exiguobacterium TaxID=2644629 RepID=UPI00103FC9DA|nr:MULTISPECIES: DUF4097 family beta strand repeat-containing protein [unclassified Exiguobacterium]TCI65506.1 hypothetical protein EVJ21_02660 [Exiguobacterium sp. SH0S2]TCI80072.1 hypothetical protein EVJ20_01755 [Exiguobacterium sp. SH0S1]
MAYSRIKGQSLKARFQNIPKHRKIAFGLVLTVLPLLFFVNLFVFSHMLALGDKYEDRYQMKKLRLETAHGNVEFIRSTNEKVQIEVLQTNSKERRIKVKSVGDTISVVERYGPMSQFGSRASAEPSRYKIRVALPSSMTSIEVTAEQVTGQGLVAKTIVLDANAVNLKKLESDRLRVETRSDATFETVRVVTGDIRSYRDATIRDVVVNQALTVQTEAGALMYEPRNATGQVTVTTTGNIAAAERFKEISNGVYHLSNSNRPNVELISETGKVELK